jgi:hypothetical protein
MENNLCCHLASKQVVDLSCGRRMKILKVKEGRLEPKTCKIIKTAL